MRLQLALLVALGALAGCGTNGKEAAEPAAPPPRSAAATGRSNVGCDVVAQCFPQLAQATLDRCPRSRLSPRGREARRRLERLLARITDVDLHNEQAYEATDAVVAALRQLEQACA